MSITIVGTHKTYRRSEFLLDQWHAITLHASAGESNKSLSMTGHRAFIESAMLSACWAVRCTPLPSGSRWAFSWTIGSTGNVRGQLHSWSDDIGRGDLVSDVQWAEAFCDGFWRHLHDMDMQVRKLRRDMAKFANVEAQLPLF